MKLLVLIGCSVESVGAGQSDAGIAHLCDLFVSLQMPASGDAIQAQKKGSTELADVLRNPCVMTQLKVEAEKMKAYYKQAHSLQKACGLSDFPEVPLASSVESFGIEEFLANRRTVKNSKARTFRKLCCSETKSTL